MTTIRTLESQLHYSLVRRSQGGAGGGKSSLTEMGQKLLERYEAYAAAVRGAAGELYDEFFAEMFG